MTDIHSISYEIIQIPVYNVYTGISLYILVYTRISLLIPFSICSFHAIVYGGTQLVYAAIFEIY